MSVSKPAPGCALLPPARFALAHVTRIASGLVGTSALFLESPLQHRLRDAHAMTRHMMVPPGTYELAGEVLPGLTTDASML